jgi:hypothetical protein
MGFIARPVRMPEDLLEWIGEKAKKDGRSWNQMAVRILELARKKDLARQLKGQEKEKETVHV